MLIITVPEQQRILAELTARRDDWQKNLQHAERQNQMTAAELKEVYGRTETKKHVKRMLELTVHYAKQAENHLQDITKAFELINAVQSPVKANPQDYPAFAAVS